MHPYKKQPAHAFWGKAISGIDYQSIDPFVNSKFFIGSHQKIASAGSCFAQHISRYLINKNINFYYAEKPHTLIPNNIQKDFSYTDFSARYGNIYTAKQLIQLFDRAFGIFTPHESSWKNKDGFWIDPFRPNIQPKGFRSEAELIADRHSHLLSVKEMFRNLDVFIFTLGLTEQWFSKIDGAVFPICPGVIAGKFNRNKYGFLNSSSEQIISDLVTFNQKLKRINPKARIILTVSPVPLVATAEDRHVLCSTTYSKSVLRVACEEIEKRFKNVCYFPSYEIITASFSRGKYFSPDLRNVTNEGVDHVMRIFLKLFSNERSKKKSFKVKGTTKLINEMEISSKLNCDEIALEEKK